MHLHTMGATVVKGKMYFTSYDFNALFYIDIDEKKVVYKTYFEAYAKNRRELYGKQILHAGKIYFIPRLCNKVAIYDTETEKIDYIEIREKGEEPIRDAFIEKNNLWMIYNEYPAYIFKINLSTGRYVIIDFDWSKMEKEINFSERTMSYEDRKAIFRGAKQIGQCWWLLPYRHGHLIAYDWKRNEFKAKTFSYFKDKVVREDVGEKVWLAANDEDRILEYCYKDKTEKWIQLPEISQIPGNITGMFEQGEYLLLLKEKGIIVIQKKNYKAEQFLFVQKKYLSSYIVYGEKMLFFPTRGKGLIIFDMSDNRVQEYDFEWKESITSENVQEYFGGGISDDAYGLEKFAELMLGSRKPDYGNCGTMIWNALRAQVDLIK